MSILLKSWIHPTLDLGSSVIENAINHVAFTLKQAPQALPKMNFPLGPLVPQQESGLASLGLGGGHVFGSSKRYTNNLYNMAASRDSAESEDVAGAPIWNLPDLTDAKPRTDLLVQDLKKENRLYDGKLNHFNEIASAVYEPTPDHHLNVLIAINQLVGSMVHIFKIYEQLEEAGIQTGEILAKFKRNVNVIAGDVLRQLVMVVHNCKDQVSDIPLLKEQFGELDELLDDAAKYTDDDIFMPMKMMIADFVSES